MTRGQERVVALALIAFGVVGVWVSKRPTTDIAMGVIGGLGCLLLIAPWALRSWGDAASRRRVAARRRGQREVPWTMFSTPSDLSGRWLVGIQRRMADGTVLDRRVLNTLDEDDEMAILEAEGLADLKASRWNRTTDGGAR